MLEIARTTHGAEIYTVNRHDGDIILECYTVNTIGRDAFAIPTERAGWLKASIPDVAVQPDPVVVQFPRKGIVTHPLQAIADTLEAHAEAGEPLSPAEMQRLAATLRGLAGCPMDGVARLPMLGRLVPGSPVCGGIDA